MKKLSILASVPVLIGGLWFGSQWYFAGQVDNSIKQFIDQANSQSDLSKIKFELVKLEKINSEQQAVIKITSTHPLLQKILEDKDGPFKEGLQFISHIKSGPVFFDEGFQLGQARINTELDLKSLNVSAETLNKIKASFANKPPLEVKSLVGLNGGGNYKTTINPANFLDENEGTIQFDGLTMTGNLDKIGDHKLTIGKLNINDEKHKDKITFAGLDGVFQATGETQGTFKAKAGQLQIANAADQSELTIPSTEIEYQLKGIAAGTALGTSDTKMPQASFKLPDLAKPLEADITLHAAQDIKEGSAQGSMQLALDNIKGVEDRVNKLGFNVNVAGLGAAGLEDISKQSEQVQALQLQMAAVSTELAQLAPPAEETQDKTANTNSTDKQTAETEPEEPAVSAQQQTLLSKRDELNSQIGDAIAQLAQTFITKVLQSGKTKLDVTLNAANAKGKLDTTLNLAYVGQLPSAANFQGIVEKLQRLPPEEWTKIFQGQLTIVGDQAALPAEIQPMLQPYIQAGTIQQKGEQLTHEVGFGNGGFTFNNAAIPMQELVGKYMLLGIGQNANERIDSPLSSDATHESVPSKNAKSKKHK